MAAELSGQKWATNWIFALWKVKVWDDPSQRLTSLWLSRREACVLVPLRPCLLLRDKHFSSLQSFSLGEERVAGAFAKREAGTL